jgi:hypothetical protein
MSKQRTREAKDVTAPEAPAKAATSRRDEDLRPHLYWPKGRPKPTTWTRQRPAVPCEKCSRILTDNMSQAVVCDGGVSEKSGKAYLRCRVCEHRFTLSVPEAKRQ